MYLFRLAVPELCKRGDAGNSDVPKRRRKILPLSKKLLCRRIARMISVHRVPEVAGKWKLYTFKLHFCTGGVIQALSVEDRG